MNDRRLAFIYTPEIEELRYPDDCPFKTQRAGLVRERLRSFGSLGGGKRAEVTPRQATSAELARLHTAAYLEQLQRASSGDLTVDALHMGIGGSDTPVFPALFDYGRWAVGAGLTAAEVLLEDQADIAFNLLGGFHHAFAARAGGFCYLNDVVLACDRLAAAGKRVFCLDVDAHHGDGTQAAFYRRADVFTTSIHESGRTLYPWGGWESETGEAEGEGFNANLGLPAGCHDAAFLRAVDEFALPLLEAFDPDVVVVELGMDTLAGDPLTHLSMTNNICMELSTRLLACGRPLLIIGGGGYHVENTVRAWALTWRALGGEEEEHDLSLGMGGVFLGSSEWAGGLRDPERPVDPQQGQEVDTALDDALTRAREKLFPRHGLPAVRPAAPRADGAEHST
jgi:acetoin utilization protein AcuC